MRQGLFSLVAGKRTRDAGGESRILLYESEARRIARYARSSPQLEIGGDLLGFYSPSGTPLVFVASGPGAAARRDATHFQQDPQFQVDVFNQLATKFRMFYVGDWHSHHTLGLSQPSGSDDAKLQDLANKNGWPQLFSLIVQTEFPGGRSNYQDYRSVEISRRGSQREAPAGPIEGFGVWWNAFQYMFRGQDPVRHRVEVEFQTGENPYEAASESIEAAIQFGPHQSGYEARGLASAVLPPLETLGRSEITIGGDDFLLNIYRNVCKQLTGELDKAEMELDLESPSGPRLIVVDRGEKVICSIRSHSDSALGVVVEPERGKQIAFEVPLEHGQIDSADVVRIVACVLSQFKPTDDRKNIGRKRA